MSNLPNSKLKDLENEHPQAVQQLVSSLKELHEMGRPQTDHEVQERIDKYFEFCEKSSVRPGIESLCLALHISRTTLYRWSIGEDCSVQRAECVQSAKTFISAFIEQASLSGKLNPATSIFLMKNWMNYKDAYSLEQIAAENRTIKSDAPNIPELMKKYGVEDDEEDIAEPMLHD